MVRQGNSAPRWFSSRARSRLRQQIRAEAQRVAGPARLGEGQERDVDLRVPEVVALIARAGDALGGDPPLVRAGRGLRQLVQAPAGGLLLRWLPGELHIGARPEVLEVLVLRLELCLEAAAPHPVQGAAAAVEQLTVGDRARGMIGDGFAHGQRLALLEVGAHHLAAQIRAGVHQLLDRGVGVHLVIRADGQGHPRVRDPVPQQHPAITVPVLQRLQHAMGEGGGAARIRLVRDRPPATPLP